MANHNYRLVITTTVSGQFAQNVLHYAFDDGSFLTTAQAALALCTAWDSANTAGFRSILSIQTKLVSLKARALNISGGFEAFFPYPAGLAGVIAGTQQVSGVGALVVFLPVNNLKQRGRLFLPGIPDNDCVDGVLTTGYAGTFASAAHIFTDQLTLTGGGSPVASPVIYSKGPPPFSHQIKYAKLSPLVATLKRRMKPSA